MLTDEVDCSIARNPSALVDTFLVTLCMAKTRTNAVGEAERASCLDTATNVLDLGRSLGLARLLVQLAKVPSRENLEARDDLLADQVLDRLDGAAFGDLHLQLALAELEREDLGDEAVHVRFGDHILTGDTKVDVTLADESRDVGRGQEDPVSGGARGRSALACKEPRTDRRFPSQRHVVVPDEADIEAVRAGELNVGTWSR